FFVLFGFSCAFCRICWAKPAAGVQFVGMTPGGIRAFILLVFSCISLAAAPETHVVIMHTNDIRGHILPGPDACCSARLASVVGLTSQEITGHPQNVKYVDVADPVRTLEDLLPRIRQRADTIILLANVRRTEEQRIARAFPEIRLIIGAHEEADLPMRIGQTTIVGTGKFGKYVGRL